MTLIDTKTDTTTVARNWPYRFDYPHYGGGYGISYGQNYASSGDALYNYISAFAKQLTETDTTLNELYNQRFIDTATGRELEKLGAEVGVSRKDGEDDDTLRFRVKFQKAIAASNGTASEIEQIISLAFGKSALSNISVSHSTGHPVTQFDIPQSFIDNIPLSRTEFEESLEKAFPAGFGVTVTTSDTLVLGESGSQGLGNGGLI